MIGLNIFRILNCLDAVWKQFGFSKAEQLNLTSVAWLTQDRILTGTFTGRLLLIDNGDLKAIFNAEELSILQIKVKEE